jgi:hypothetical protein
VTPKRHEKRKKAEKHAVKPRNTYEVFGNQLREMAFFASELYPDVNEGHPIVDAILGSAKALNTFI